jgi:low affinity Fe/Cu permease
MSGASRFSNLARHAASWAGHPSAFLCAVVVVLGWAFTGPLFGFSDTWQLVINTGTTIITFLMVFLIQNSQNRDTIAIHVKLDELVRAVKEARNSVIDLEDMDEEDLRKLLAKYRKLASSECDGAGLETPAVGQVPPDAMQ